MVFGALPQDLLCACTKESAFACSFADYTAAMDTVSEQNKSNITADAAAEELAEAFLDLWQDNIRLWSEERDLFTLQNLIEEIKKSEKHEGDSDGV